MGLPFHHRKRGPGGVDENQPVEPFPSTHFRLGTSGKIARHAFTRADARANLTGMSDGGAVQEIGVSAPERARRTLARGVLIYRWVSLAWMSVIALTATGDFRRELLAWASIGLAGAWTAWLTVASRRFDRITLWIDLAICGWLLVVSALVVFDGEVVSGRAFFATGYPFAAALTWGVSRGVRGGLFAGSLLGLVLVQTRPLNGIGLDELDSAQIQDLVGSIVNYLLAGGAVGIVSQLLTRSSEALQTATEELVRERERAARLAERESLARQIHDSVLQVLSLIHKRGRELARAPSIPPEEVAELSRLAEKEEQELRSLILREPEGVPAGRLSLRDDLEAAARSVDGVPASVSCVGPLWVDRGVGEEVVAAVRQALANAAEHAGATRVTVFAEEDRGTLTVSVRDDGIGFVYDEAALKANGKAGILKSVKGRVEDLGGSLLVTTAPGKGTELELTVPIAGATQ